MFLFHRPDQNRLQTILEQQRTLPLSYAEVGCTQWLEQPSGDGRALRLSRRWSIDRYRQQLGTGEATYQRARHAFQRWQMLDVGWLQPCWRDAACRPGEIQGTVMRLGGLWCVNLCRLVDVQSSEEPRRLSIAQGTLPGHVEAGEERFTLEWHAADDSVWFEILAVSRPSHPLTRLGYPIARRYQRRFGRDSLRAMARAAGPASDEFLLQATARA